MLYSKIWQFVTAICALLIAGTLTTALAQQTVLQGKVIQEGTTSPINVTYWLKDASGKMMRGETENGHFKAVVEIGQTYSLILKSGKTLQYEQTLNIPKPKGDKYEDVEMTFAVQKLQEGMVWLKEEVFAGAALSAAGKEILDDIIKEMKMNRGLKIAVSTNGGEQEKVLQDYFQENYKAAARSRVEYRQGAAANHITVTITKIGS